jgi:hypothetical protein
MFTDLRMVSPFREMGSAKDLPFAGQTGLTSVNPTFGDRQSACIEDPSFAVATRTASVSQSLSSAVRPPHTPKERVTMRDFDALLPPEIAQKAELLGAEKTRLDAVSLLILAVLAGAFIALGARFAITTLAGADGVLPFGVSRLLAGGVF